MLNYLRLKQIGFSLIAFEAQLRERASRDEDSGGARTLTDDSKEERYIHERRSSRNVEALKKKRVIIKAEEHYVSRIPLSRWS